MIRSTHQPSDATHCFFGTPSFLSESTSHSTVTSNLLHTPNSESLIHEYFRVSSVFQLTTKHGSYHSSIPLWIISCGEPSLVQGQPESPKFSPRNTMLSALRYGDTSGGTPANGSTPARKPSHNQPVTARGKGRHGVGPGSGGWGAGEEKPAAGPATREQCPQCGAVFGDVSTLLNHVERFHPKVYMHFCPTFIFLPLDQAEVVLPPTNKNGIRGG